jgi:hypothetical protein
VRGVPGEVIGPVHHIQPHEGGGEENAAKHVDTLGARLVPGISWQNIYISRKSTFGKFANEMRTFVFQQTYMLAK